MSEGSIAPGNCTLEVARLFERINSGRKMRSLPPVENSAIASRCNLRFNLDKKRGVDFTQKSVVIAIEDIVVLEQLLNEQFDCHLEGAVDKLCVRPQLAKEVEAEPETAEEEEEQEPPKTVAEERLMSKIRKIFGGE